MAAAAEPAAAPTACPDSLQGDSDSDCCSGEGLIHYHFDDTEGMRYFIDMTGEQRVRQPELYRRLEQRARRKMQTGFRFQGVDPLFDPVADEEDEAWVGRRVAAVKRKSATPSSGPDSTAHLSCPGCFATLSLTSTRHGPLEANVWRADTLGPECTVGWDKAVRAEPPELAAAGGASRPGGAERQRPARHKRPRGSQPLPAATAGPSPCHARPAPPGQPHAAQGQGGLRWWHSEAAASDAAAAPGGPSQSWDWSWLDRPPRSPAIPRAARRPCSDPAPAADSAPAANPAPAGSEGASPAGETDKPTGRDAGRDAGYRAQGAPQYWRLRCAACRAQVGWRHGTPHGGAAAFFFTAALPSEL
eukprot:TRINITY_DN56585_c0_g1_i1.p1 TRINITY_DN56585_c0_g1~~TRINITY_DN56585_c0_g1_i1.p1  ORF type:complete len:392 (+),score=77.20 TRINITY_DN56585_c0_g1_i1:97-1176(+)